MKDARTHLTQKAELAVYLETGAIVGGPRMMRIANSRASQPIDDR
jgi:hypothetical protein